MERVIEPELLDELPAEDPRAIWSRGDLRRINALMGNARLLAALLRQELPQPPRRVLEIGSGDGTTMLALARRLAPGWKQPVDLQLLDLRPVIQPETLRAFGDLGWRVEVVTADLKEWTRAMPETGLVIANLFLHHFQDRELASFFGEFAARSRAFASCDPRRWRPALFTTRLLGMIGCNDVTRHDAVASVRAGFREKELSRLWPRTGGWELAERAGGYASHLFFARKCG